MSRPNTFQVALSIDEAATLKRTAATMGLKPATFARLLLSQALKTPYAPIFPTRPPAPNKATRP
jgi:hypothetical protein